MTLLITADELPAPQPPAVPNWSENYLFQGYDAGSGYGVWFHFGSPVFDPSLWQDISMIYLPGGEEVLLAKGMAARKAGAPGPTGSMLSATLGADSWILRFHGAARRVRVADISAGLLTDGPEQPLSLELVYRGMSPVWNLSHSMDTQDWANAHWEQPCTVSGDIEYHGGSAHFEGSGVRDHSRGARDFSSLTGHLWLHGQFDDGRGFGIIHMMQKASTMSRAYLVEGERIEDVTVVSVPDRVQAGVAFAVGLRRDCGTEVRITGQLVGDIPLTVRDPNDVLIGHDSNPAPGLWFYEGQARWNWDGDIGYGLAERSTRIFG